MLLVLPGPTGLHAARLQLAPVLRVRLQQQLVGKLVAGQTRSLHAEQTVLAHPLLLLAHAVLSCWAPQQYVLAGVLGN